MDIKDVENLAKLARIELGEDEKQELLSDMESILGYVKAVQTAEGGELKTEGQAYNVWREDLPDSTSSPRADGREFSREIITSQFPDAKDGFLKVKKIL